MLWTAFVTIVLLWCLAIAVSFTLGGFIHIMPVLAAVTAVAGNRQRRELI